MDSKIMVCLIDIQQCIKEIFVFIQECQDFLSYKNDLKTKKAVERNLEIIGEAVNRILKIDNAFPFENARNIVALRNRIIHSYDNISDEIIWTIVKRDLSNLQIQIETLLKK